MGTFPAARQRVLCIAVGALFILTTAPVPAQSDTFPSASEVRSTFEQHRTDDYKQAATAYLGLIAATSRMLDSEDPRPSTEENERVAEHLERVAVALERYGDESFPAGFDDRGMIYVRLGAPSHVARIRNAFMLTGGAAQMAFEFPDALTIPPNEFRTYADLAAASYLFIRVRGWLSGSCAG